MGVRRPAWWFYPERCANGHEWGPGLVLVSWKRCHCAPAPRGAPGAARLGPSDRRVPGARLPVGVVPAAARSGHWLSPSLAFARRGGGCWAATGTAAPAGLPPGAQQRPDWWCYPAYSRRCHSSVIVTPPKRCRVRRLALRWLGRLTMVSVRRLPKIVLRRYVRRVSTQPYRGAAG